MFLVLMLLFLIAASFLLKKTVLFVPHGYAWTVERFGKYSRTADPGVLYLLPVVQRVGHKVNMMEQALEVPRQDVSTRDNIVVKVSAVVFFQVFDAAKAAYSESNVEQAIVALVTANIRNVIGSMDLVESMTGRDEINARVLDAVDPAADRRGVKVKQILIKDVQPPQEVVAAMAREMQAERERLRASRQ